MINILLISKNISEYEKLVDACNEITVAIVYDPKVDTYETLLNKIKNIDSANIVNIAIAAHSSSLPIFKLLDTEVECILPTVEDSSMDSWNNFINNFLKKLKENIINLENLDLLGCSIYSISGWKKAIAYLEKEVDINIRASDNKTGNQLSGGDWILESDAINIKDIYFNINIEDFTTSLVSWREDLVILMRENNTINLKDYIGNWNDRILEDVKIHSNSLGEYNYNWLGYKRDGNPSGGRSITKWEILKNNDTTLLDYTNLSTLRLFWWDKSMNWDIIYTAYLHNGIREIWINNYLVSPRGDDEAFGPLQVALYDKNADKTRGIRYVSIGHNTKTGYIYREGHGWKKDGTVHTWRTSLVMWYYKESFVKIADLIPYKRPLGTSKYTHTIDINYNKNEILDITVSDTESGKRITFDLRTLLEDNRNLVITETPPNNIYSITHSGLASDPSNQWLWNTDITILPKYSTTVDSTTGNLVSDSINLSFAITDSRPAVPVSYDLGLEPFILGINTPPYSQPYYELRTKLTFSLSGILHDPTLEVICNNNPPGLERVYISVRNDEGDNIIPLTDSTLYQAIGAPENEWQTFLVVEPFYIESVTALNLTFTIRDSNPTNQAAIEGNYINYTYTIPKMNEIIKIQVIPVATLNSNIMKIFYNQVTQDSRLELLAADQTYSGFSMECESLDYLVRYRAQIQYAIGNIMQGEILTEPRCFYGLPGEYDGKDSTGKINLLLDDLGDSYTIGLVDTTWVNQDGHRVELFTIEDINDVNSQRLNLEITIPTRSVVEINYDKNTSIKYNSVVGRRYLNPENGITIEIIFSENMVGIMESEILNSHIYIGPKANIYEEQETGYRYWNPAYWKKAIDVGTLNFQPMDMYKTIWRGTFIPNPDDVTCGFGLPYLEQNNNPYASAELQLILSKPKNSIFIRHDYDYWLVTGTNKAHPHYSTPFYIEKGDRDRDGVYNEVDAFPTDPTETADTDNDGVGDNADAFPTDATETKDTDNDGVGDNADVFPNDATETVDTDNDGVGDNADAFPIDPAETKDTDNDGTGDNADQDDDDDGTLDVNDAFPKDSTEQLDTDGDGIGNNADPDDDNDGVYDSLPDHPIVGEYLAAYESRLLNPPPQLYLIYPDQTTIGLKTIHWTYTPNSWEFNINRPGAGNIITLVISAKGSGGHEITNPSQGGWSDTDTSANIELAKQLYWAIGPTLADSGGASSLVTSGWTVSHVAIDTTGFHTATITISFDESNFDAFPLDPTRSIIVPPVITLKNRSTITIVKGYDYYDSGATAYDAIDENITNNIVTTNPVNINIPDTYIIEYNITNTAGISAVTVKRTVNIVDYSTPFSTIRGQLSDNIRASIEDIRSQIDESNSAAQNKAYFTDICNDMNSETTITPEQKRAYMHEIIRAELLNGLSEISSTDLAGAMGCTNWPLSIGTMKTYSANGFYELVTGIYVAIELGQFYKVWYNDYLLGTRHHYLIQKSLIANIEMYQTMYYYENPRADISTYGTDGPLASLYTWLGVDLINSFRKIHNNKILVYGGSGGGDADITAPTITLTGTDPLTMYQGATYNEPGVTAYDAVDGDISTNIVITNLVNTAVLNTYTVKYDVNDATGNSATTVERTVIVTDGAAPSITLNGIASITIDQGATYNDQGATAEDFVDGDITDKIVTVNLVNTAVPDTYIIKYDVDDAAGNSATTVQRTVIVNDTTKPIITRTGDASITINQGDTYNEPGATATDAVDGNNVTVVIGGHQISIDSLPGIYTITYDATDTAGNKAIQLIRIVTVKDITKPVITLIGDASIKIPYDQPYNDEGATAIDTFDGNLSGFINTANPVNTYKRGTYYVTYNVTDPDGNKADEVIRTVEVVDQTAPVIMLTGPQTITIVQGTTYTDQGAMSYDATDGDWLADVDGHTISNTTLPGTYTITYNKTDAAGNKAIERTRTVIVIAPAVPPVITLKGRPRISIAKGTVYTDAGATAVDNSDTSVIVESLGTVYINIPGVYVITYDATDADGNSAIPVKRTITIVDYKAKSNTIQTKLSETASIQINSKRGAMKTRATQAEKKADFTAICTSVKTGSGTTVTVKERRTLIHEIVREAIESGLAEISSTDLAAAMGCDTWPSNLGDMIPYVANGFYHLNKNTALYVPIEPDEFYKIWYNDSTTTTTRHHYLIKKSLDTNNNEIYETLYYDESPKVNILIHGEDGPSDSLYASLGTNDNDSFRNILDGKVLVYGGGGAGGNPPPGSGGDPYIQPLNGPIYKLPDTSGNYRYLSTKEDINNRLLVDISVEKLTHTEQKELLGQMIKCNYTQLQNNRMTIDGYYYRNFYISNKHNYLKINLEDQTVITKTSKCTLGYILSKGGEATYKNFEIKVIKHKGLVCKDIAVYNQEPVIFEVIINTHNDVYGNVEIVLSSFYNKQLRNGIKIKTQNPITINNSVGALLIAQPINNIMVSKLGSKKQLKNIKPFDATNFNMLTETHFTGMNSTNKVMLKQQ